MFVCVLVFEVGQRHNKQASELRRDWTDMQERKEAIQELTVNEEERMPPGLKTQRISQVPNFSNLELEREH